MHDYSATLRLFDELSALSSLTSPGSGAPAAAWRDCAVRLELAAQDPDLSGGQRAKLVARAKVARANAAARQRTQPLPVSLAPSMERSDLAVHPVMAGARSTELDASQTVTVPLAVVGDEA